MRRRQAVLAYQWDELLCGNKEGNRVNETEQPQNDKARQPVGISRGEKLFEQGRVAHVGL
jgi:hypothetical protein